MDRGWFKCTLFRYLNPFPRRRGLIQSGVIRSTALFGPDLTYATVHKKYFMILRRAKRSWYITELMPNTRWIWCNPKQCNLNDTRTLSKKMLDLRNEKKKLCGEKQGLHGVNAMLHEATPDLMRYIYYGMQYYFVSIFNCKYIICVIWWNWFPHWITDSNICILLLLLPTLQKNAEQL